MKNIVIKLDEEQKEIIDKAEKIVNYTNFEKIDKEITIERMFYLIEDLVKEYEGQEEELNNEKYKKTNEYKKEDYEEYLYETYEDRMIQNYIMDI